MRLHALNILRVRAKPGNPHRGLMVAGPWVLPVALGRSGIKANKREGDGATPRGNFRLCRLWWRADRTPLPHGLLPARRIRPDDGWCEDPGDRAYNRSVKVPVGSPADRLWRADRLYDLIVEIDHNSRPRIVGRGSAVFIHVARPGFAPTAGCVALDPRALRQLLARVGPKTRIIIG
jgi:L,D-peptidoglycan transpeptidase YkuD (ErfK/YbiS/YcfS/YnhG family)